MPFTQTDLDEIDALIKSGATEIRFQDRMEGIDNMDGLLRRRTLIASQIAANSGPVPRRQVRMIVSSGF